MLNHETILNFTQEQIDEINKQRNARQCLVIIFGIVYDLHAFDHPGGANLIMRAAGETLDQVMKNCYHNFTETQVHTLLARYKVGFFVNNKGSLDSPTESHHSDSLGPVDISLD